MEKIDWKWLIIKVVLMIATIQLAVYSAPAGEYRHPAGWVVACFLIGYNWRTQR